MIVTPVLAWVLTAAFVLTAGYALLRWSATMTGPLPRGQRTTELAHLLMSVSMLVMTWTWFGSAGLAVQVVLFAVFTAYFVVRALRGDRGAGHACAGGTAHALAAGAMVWMLVSMPLVMAAPVSESGASGGHAGHAGHEGHAGMDVAGMSTGGQAGWAVGVTLAVCVALLVTCGYWTMRSLRRPAAPVAVAVAPAVVPGSVATLPRTEVRPVTTGSIAALATLGCPSLRSAGASALVGPRSDAACHAVMSLGMIAMLVAMVLGW